MKYINYLAVVLISISVSTFSVAQVPGQGKAYGEAGASAEAAEPRGQRPGGGPGPEGGPRRGKPAIWEDGSVIQPLAVGDIIPENSVVLDVDGNTVTLNSMAAKQPTILIFYRGSWCPFCNKHLVTLQQIQGELVEMGYQLLAISTESPSYLKSSTEEHELDFNLFSDMSLETAKKFGIGFKVNEGYMRHITEDLGVDLEANRDGVNGEDLLIPSVYLLNLKGEIKFSFVNTDHRIRISNEELLAAAEANK